MDFDGPLHHDATKYDGHIYALFADAYPVGNELVVIDGLYVFDSSGGLVETWELNDYLSLTEADLDGVRDQFWAQEFPGSLDFTHANSVFVDDSGIYVSTRWVSTVWKIKGLGEPDFGDIVWSLTGEAASPIAPDLTLTSAVPGDADFIGQHHATLSASGDLTLFDNRKVGNNSRGLVISVDEGPRTAQIIAAYPMPQSCSVQGGIFGLANGDVLVTCPSIATTFHFREGTSTEGFTMKATCNSGPGGPGGGRPQTVRMQPIDLQG